MIKNLQALVLAAGNSSRFATRRPKLLEKICGQPLILYPLKLLAQLSVPTAVVIGAQHDAIKNIVTQAMGESIAFITQDNPSGTAHAVAAAADALYHEHLLIMHGDLPLVTPAIIEQLYATHLQQAADLSCVIAHNADPQLTGYGRVIQQDQKLTLIETSSLEPHQLHDYCCINAGIFIVKKSFLETALPKLSTHESQECSFSTIINFAQEHGRLAWHVAPFDRVRGVNNFQELWEAEHIKRADLIKYWMERGVRFPVAQSVHIDLDVSIGAGSFIGCGVHVLGSTIIGQQCKIHEFSSLENSIIGDDTIIYSHSVIKDAHIGSNSQVGPFAHLRNNAMLGDNTIIGNFVELKNSSVGSHTKAKHLTYLGDATIGSHVNIGAGTITCNHNGVTKQKSFIEDHAYIGANNTLVAPVTIGNHAYTAAGSVITQDVPAHALAIARSRQTNKEGYADMIRTKNNGQSTQPTSSFGPAVKTNNDDSSSTPTNL